MADYWTISALGNSDGIGQDRLDKTFATKWTFPAGQNGNKASYYWYATTAGKEPTYATPANIEATYLLDRDGMMTYLLNTNQAGNCTQAGTPAGETMYFKPPYSYGNYHKLGSVPSSVGRANVNGVSSIGLILLSADTTRISLSYFGGAVTTITALQDDTWGDNASDDVYFITTIKVF